jgi:hypothetical protein
MTPFRLALWIAKFVASLVLLLVIIPGAVYYGGMFATHEVIEWRAARKATRDAVAYDAARPLALDCYDTKGNLLPDPFADIGGIITSCAPGQIAKPKTATPLPSCAEYYKHHEKPTPTVFDDMDKAEDKVCRP